MPVGVALHRCDVEAQERHGRREEPEHGSEAHTAIILEREVHVSPATRVWGAVLVGICHAYHALLRLLARPACSGLLAS